MYLLLPFYVFYVFYVLLTFIAIKNTYIKSNIETGKKIIQLWLVWDKDQGRKRPLNVWKCSINQMHERIKEIVLLSIHNTAYGN